MIHFGLTCRFFKLANVHSRGLSLTQSRQEDAAFAVKANISLPSTAITAGMVHNIHRISIIGHLYRPDIQIKYVQKAIDSKSREGTGGPSPPVERCQIAEKTKSNLNQVWAKPKKRQTEGSTEQQRNTVTRLSDTSTMSIPYKRRIMSLSLQ